MEFDDLKQLREQHKDGQGDRLQTPRDAHLAARAQSLEIGALAATAQGVEVDRGEHAEAAAHGVEGASAQAATLHALSGTARALPHAELLKAAFGKHSVADVEAHTDAQAQVGLEAMGARGLAGADRVVLSADADVAETARQTATALAKQAEADGQITAGDAGDREALVDAIAERTAAGRDAEDLLDRLTRETGGRGEQGAASASAAGWDGVGAGEVHGAVDKDPDEAVTEGELSADEIEAAREEAEARGTAAEVAQPWFERLVGTGDAAATGPAPATTLDMSAFDPPALQARRRKRVGEGWLFDVPATTVGVAVKSASKQPS